MSLRSKEPAAPPEHDAIIIYRHNKDTRKSNEALVARHIAFFVLGEVRNVEMAKTIKALDPQEVEELKEKRSRMQMNHATQDHLGDLELCISELLTNANLYGSQFQELIIGLGSAAVEGSDESHVFVLVKDSNPSWTPQDKLNYPELLLGLADDERRRGLDIVIYDAENYGYCIGEGSKTIWVEYGPDVNDTNIT